MSASPPPLGPTAAILIIGEEILSGKVDDENARFLLRELRGLGISVRRVEVVPDDPEDIAVTVRALASRHDHVFTSGGVGPTHDDVTLAAVAAAFEMKLERRAELEPLIRRGLGADFHERDLRMADLPEGARLVYGEGEPGRWPVVCVRNVFVLPGVPVIFRRKFETLRERLRAGAIHSRAVYSRAGEGKIAAVLDAAVAAFPALVIGSYPRVEEADYKVKITVDGRDRTAVDAAVDRLREGLGEAFVRAE
jgi:molybdenum cofactor synthesis domain-containing protein